MDGNSKEQIQSAVGPTTPVISAAGKDTKTSDIETEDRVYDFSSDFNISALKRSDADAPVDPKEITGVNTDLQQSINQLSPKLAPASGQTTNEQISLKTTEKTSEQARQQAGELRVASVDDEKKVINLFEMPVTPTMEKLLIDRDRQLRASLRKNEPVSTNEKVVQGPNANNTFETKLPASAITDKTVTPKIVPKNGPLSATVPAASTSNSTAPKTASLNTATTIPATPATMPLNAPLSADKNGNAVIPNVNLTNSTVPYKKENDPQKAIKTFEADVAEVMSSKHISTADMVIQEKKKQEQEKKEREKQLREAEQNKKNEAHNLRVREEEMTKRQKGLAREQELRQKAAQEQEARQKKEQEREQIRLQQLALQESKRSADEERKAAEFAEEQERKRQEDMQKAAMLSQRAEELAQKNEQIEKEKTRQAQAKEVQDSLEAEIKAREKGAPASFSLQPSQNAPVFTGQNVHAQIFSPAMNVPGARSVTLNNPSVGPKRHPVLKFLLISFSIVFVLGGLAGGYYLYSKSALVPNVVNLSEFPNGQNTIVSSDLKSTVNTDGLSANQILAHIKVELEKPQQANTVREISLVTTQENKSSKLAATNALDRLNIHAPDILIRALTPDWILGVYANSASEKTAFVIVQHSFFQNAFAGMLAWENTMVDDIKQYVYPGNSQNFSIKGKFVDGIVKNKDVREFVSENGNILFLYSFIDSNKIVITGNEATLSEVITRLEKQGYMR